MRHRILRSSSWAFAVLLGVTSLSVLPWRAARAQQGELFVVGTLYRKHETVPTYDLPALRRLILDIRPDVLVLDVTPTELKQEKVWPGKVEYTGVVFPLMHEGSYRAYAAEPPEPMFSEISQAWTAALRSLETARPEAASAFKEYVARTYATLAGYWRSPVEVNSALTDQLLAAKKAMEGQLVGPVVADLGRRWNRHAAEVAVRAASENPGKRVLVLTGIENCHEVRALLRRNPAVHLVDVEQWLRGRAPAETR